MPDEISVPIAVAQSALEAHAQMDAAEHTEIANTEDEDYKWLTDRLDALSTEVASLRSSLANQSQEMIAAFQETREQSRTLIEAQTRMIETLTSNLTALSESALLRSLPSDSANSSNNEPQIETTEPATETVTEVSVEPANQEPMRDSDVASAASQKKRRRI